MKCIGSKHWCHANNSCEFLGEQLNYILCAFTHPWPIALNMKLFKLTTLQDIWESNIKAATSLRPAVLEQLASVVLFFSFFFFSFTKWVLNMLFMFLLMMKFLIKLRTLLYPSFPKAPPFSELKRYETYLSL